MEIKQHIDDFLRELCDNKVAIYNEFSLQHELGIYLRDKLKHKKIEFERNISYFGLSNNSKTFTKKEIDISIYDTQSTIAIELKFPRNGQYPESMFSFCKDLKFLEELKANGFQECYFLAIVDDKNFYSRDGLSTNGIYEYFRTENLPNPIPCIKSPVQKPTGKKDYSISLNGKYQIEWKQFCKHNSCYDNWRYCLIEINLATSGKIIINQNTCK